MDIFQHYGKHHKSFEFPTQVGLRGDSFGQVDVTAFLNLVLYYRTEGLISAEDPSETTEGSEVLEGLGNLSPVVHKHKYKYEYNARKKNCGGEVD